MTDFTERMRLKEKAAEDLYFAQLDRKLIQRLHEKQTQQFLTELQQLNKAEPACQATQDKH